jgi:23S rRNA (cytosine1962-C5)-methyltransferase
MERRRLILRRGRERVIANRHPWIFSGAIASEEGPENAAIGDLVDEDGRLLASGFYSAHSQIRLRALSFEQAVDFELIRARIAAAIGKRRGVLSGETTAARLIHSEGDFLSGLVVDRYGDHLVVEITSAGLEQIRDLVIDSLREAVAPRSILFLNDLPARKLERISLENFALGEPPDQIVIREHGLSFAVAPERGQKTGFFLDQRESRLLARSLAGGARVLNLFAYSGGFGVNAAAGGAALVEEVDTSAAAIEVARQNHELNATPCEVRFVTADAFAHVRALLARGESYDLVVCDPPAFAKSRGEVDRAARGYKDIALHAMRLVRPGGILMSFSCSGHISLDLFQKITFAAALDARRHATILQRLGAGSDHPVSIYCPEGEYLKGFLMRVD